MTFLHPALLAVGLAAIAIPIVIHFLFRRRRKPVRWGAMRFLLEAYRKQRRRLRLEQLVLLAVRCLIIACAAIAIGRPLLDRAGLLAGGAGRTVYLLVDNSITSQIRPTPDDEPALARHKREAIEMLNALGPGARAGLITLASPAEAVVAPPSSDLAAVRRLIEEIEPTDARADVAGGLRAAAASAGAEGDLPGDVVVAVLSAFREGAAPLGESLPPVLAGLDRAVITAPAPAAEAVGNVQVVSVDPVRQVLTPRGPEGGAPQQVRVGLKRFGPAIGEASVTSVQVRLLDPSGRPLDAGAPARTTVRWRPGQEVADASVQVRGAWGSLDRGQVVLAASIDQDALAADNAASRAVAVRGALRVGVVAQRRFGRGPRVDQLAPADWIRMALEPGPQGPIDIVDVEPAAVDGAILSGLDAVFLPSPDLISDESWSRLRAFADAGGLLVVQPPVAGGVNLWPDDMARALGLDWRIARDPVAHEPPLGLVRTETVSTLLSLLQGELEDLLRPVEVRRSLPILQAGPGAETPVRLAGAEGAAWLTAAAPGSAEIEGETDGPPAARGLIVYMASPLSLEWTDLPAKPLVVPLLQELVRQGVGRAEEAGSWIAGRGARAPGDAVRLESASGGGVRLLGATGEPESPIREAGLWRAVDAAGRDLGVIVVNADPRGGATDPPPAEALESWLAAAGGGVNGGGGRGPRVSLFDPGDASSVFVESGKGSPWSLPLLVAALVLAVVETGLARWFSHAAREKVGAAAPGGRAVAA